MGKNEQLLENMTGFLRWVQKDINKVCKTVTTMYTVKYMGARGSVDKKNSDWSLTTNAHNVAFPSLSSFGSIVVKCVITTLF